MVDPDSDRVSRAPPYSGTASWRTNDFAYKTVTFFGPAFQLILLSLIFDHSTGHPHAALQHRLRRFGLLRVRSPLLAESLLISFPGLLRWFTSSSMAPVSYFIQIFRCRNRFLRVTPFGYLRVNGYVLLTAAFRSLSRPSSSYSSKASAMNLYSLDHIISFSPTITIAT